MTDAPASESAWLVVCDNYVSRHDQMADAFLHKETLKGKQCKADHKVIYGNLPSGSRLKEK